jgi:hypothetical protein
VVQEIETNDFLGLETEGVAESACQAEDPTVSGDRQVIYWKSVYPFAGEALLVRGRDGKLRCDARNYGRTSSRMKPCNFITVPMCDCLLPFLTESAEGSGSR